MTAAGHEMLQALPHRHPHRAALAPGPLPAGLLPELQHDAMAERARLDIVGQGRAYQRLDHIVSAAARRLDLDPRARAETRYWSGNPAGPGGIPPQAFPATTTRQPGRPASVTSTSAAASGC